MEELKEFLLGHEIPVYIKGTGKTGLFYYFSKLVLERYPDFKGNIDVGYDGRELYVYITSDGGKYVGVPTGIKKAAEKPFRVNGRCVPNGVSVSNGGSCSNGGSDNSEPVNPDFERIEQFMFPLAEEIEDMKPVLVGKSRCSDAFRGHR
jgi:hypothetical protein